MQENYLLLGGWSRNASSYQGVIKTVPKNAKIFILAHSIIDVSGKPEAINRNILDFIKEKQLTSFILIGHSLGGALAIGFAYEHPQYIQKLILIDSAGIIIKESIFIVIWNLCKNNVMFGLSKLKDNIIAILRIFLQSLTYLAAARYTMTADVKEKAQMIKIPAVILWGENDVIFPVENGKELEGLIPHAKLIILPRMDHDWILHYPEGLWNDIKNTK